MRPRLLLLRTKILKVYSQEKQRPLQKRRHNKHPPSTPSLRSQPRRQTSCKNQAPGCLDTHHRYTETTHAAEPKGSVDLGKVLDRGEDSGEDTQEIRPCLQ